MPITPDAIIAEGQRLAKPSLWLSEAPSPFGMVAYWAGQGREQYRGRDDDRHQITIDCRWLSNHGFRLAGSLGVYRVDPRWRWRVPIWLDRQEKPLGELGTRDGIPLYGHETPSLPPIQAVCLYGGAIVDQWLDSEGLERTDYDDAAMTPVGEAYEEYYRGLSPLFSDGYAAVLGGWHAMWPDDEFYVPREMRLVLWTLRDAEPWVEVFERGCNLPIRIRNHIGCRSPDHPPHAPRVNHKRSQHTGERVHTYTASSGSRSWNWVAWVSILEITRCFGSAWESTKYPAELTDCLSFTIGTSERPNWQSDLVKKTGTHELPVSVRSPIAGRRGRI